MNQITARAIMTAYCKKFEGKIWVTDTPHKIAYPCLDLWGKDYPNNNGIRLTAIGITKTELEFILDPKAAGKKGIYTLILADPEMMGKLDELVAKICIRRNIELPDALDHTKTFAFLNAEHGTDGQYKICHTPFIPDLISVDELDS